MLIAFLLYCGFINFIGIALMGTDKSEARRGGYRISEKRLFTIALIGGAGGIWIGMYWFRHKTKHKSFTYGIPLLFVANVIAQLYLFELVRKGGAYLV